MRHASEEKQAPHLPPGVTEDDGLSDSESLVQVTQGVQLPLLALHRDVELADTWGRSREIGAGEAGAGEAGEVREVGEVSLSLTKSIMEVVVSYPQG